MDFIVTYAWVGALLFCRIGTVLMLAPGVGETSVPTTFRLTIAVLVTMVLAPVLAEKTPQAPAAFGDAALIIIGEVLIGLMFGAGARLFMSALQVAGQMIALFSGLAAAQQFNPVSGESGAIVALFLSMVALVLIMATGIHRDMIQATADSYQMFPPGTPMYIGDIAEWELASMSKAFKLGLQIAAPILVFALVFNLSLGLVARLIPQVQIFFIAMPTQVHMGMVILAIVLGGGLLAWIEALKRYASLQGPY